MVGLPGRAPFVGPAGLTLLAFVAGGGLASHADPAAASETDHPAPAAPRADTVVRVWGSTVTATAGARATMRIHLDMTESGEALGRIRGRARFAPTLLNFQGAEPGDAVPALVLDTERGDAGVLGFELTVEDPGGIDGPAVLAEVTFWVTAGPGGLAPVTVELDVLEAADGSDLLPRTEVSEGTVLVR